MIHRSFNLVMTDLETRGFDSVFLLDEDARGRRTELHLDARLVRELRNFYQEHPFDQAPEIEFDATAGFISVPGRMKGGFLLEVLRKFRDSLIVSDGSHDEPIDPKELEEIICHAVKKFLAIQELLMATKKVRIEVQVDGNIQVKVVFSPAIPAFNHGRRLPEEIDIPFKMSSPRRAHLEAISALSQKIIQLTIPKPKQ